MTFDAHPASASNGTEPARRQHPLLPEGEDRLRSQALRVEAWEV